MRDLFDNKNIKPMLLSETNKPFNDKDYIFEIKFDGIRAFIYASPTEITIINRRGNNYTLQYPELNDIKKVVQNKVIFDGEIVLLVDGKPSFNKLQERALLKDKRRIDYYKENHPVVFVCFDIIYDKKDITKNTLMERKKILSKFKDTKYFIKTKYIEQDGKSLYEASRKHELEGIVAKNKYSEYLLNKRSKHWVKIKNLKKEYFYIGGYKDEKDIAVLSILIGRKENDKLIFVGKTSVGKKREAYKVIKKAKAINKTPFENDTNHDYKYIKPDLICEVEYIEKTKGGSVRQPIFKGLYYKE